MLASALRVAVVTPSQTTRAARPVPSAQTAIASSLSSCRIPRSQTAATCSAGRALKWWRGSGRRDPHSVHQPSSS